jgi:hypothetical protein
LAALAGWSRLWLRAVPGGRVKLMTDDKPTTPFRPRATTMNEYNAKQEKRKPAGKAKR